MDTPSFGSVEGVNQTITATYTDSNIDLPDQHDIKQGWVSSSPRTVMDQMNKIIKTLDVFHNFNFFSGCTCCLHLSQVQVF